MDISLDYKGNELKAEYSLRNGILRSGCTYSFRLKVPENVDVTIEENGSRTILISCDEEIEIKKMYGILADLERLLLIFDGAFLSLTQLFFSGNGKTSTYVSLAEQYKAKRLHYFELAEYPSIIIDRLLNYENVLTSELYVNWQELLADLDVVNQMYLYVISDCGFTCDVKCAFLVELSESLIEIIGINNLKNPDNRTLKSCLRTLICNFGDDIFKREKEFDLERILTLLIKNRVNIMHIKTNREKSSLLTGKEYFLYAIKLSYLYRIIVLSMLGIDKSIYIDTLKKKISNWDNWNGVQSRLFKRLENSK